MKNLNEYYPTPHWQHTRKKRLEIDSYTCRTCGVREPEYSLHVHHLRYNLFNEDIDNDLITLCKDCHEAVTSVIRARRYQNKKITITPIEERTSYYGLEKQELSIEIGITVDLAQRFVSVPAESDHDSNEETVWQEIENGSRPGSTRKT